MHTGTHAFGVFLIWREELGQTVRERMIGLKKTVMAGIPRYAGTAA